MNPELVKQVADAIEQLIAGEQVYIPDLLEAVKLEIWKREDTRRKAQIEQEIAEKTAARKRENLLTWTEYAGKYGFHQSERHAGSRILATANRDRGIYFRDVEPTPEQRERVAQDTTMSARQAAEYLGISRYQFDKLKKQHRLEHVGNIRTGHTASGFTKAAYLYSKADIDRLKPAVKRESGNL